MIRILLVILCMISTTAQAEDAMTQEQMERIVKQVADNATGQQGVVEFTFRGMAMALMSDVAHDRMRIVSPIAEYDKLSKEEVTKAMESNYHSALDARYALSNGVLYSAYIHPLSKLDEEQLRSAVPQVFHLRASFGSEYSSGVLNFGDR